MFDVGLQEMVLIGVIALLVFGPGKLPELGRMLGRLMREFRQASDEFRQTVETNLHINDPEPVIQPPVAETPAPALEPAAALPSEGEITPAFESPVAAAVAPPAEPFCAQRGARLFHKSDCAWVKRVPETERQYFKHVAEARDQGFATCPVCEPWEPAS
jgi:TatA/E family protein of Tat protein translocase